jgi:hypothetical protein
VSLAIDGIPRLLDVPCKNTVSFEEASSVLKKFWIFNHFCILLLVINCFFSRTLALSAGQFHCK